MDTAKEGGRASGTTEMRMLRWIMGISLKDHKRNEDIRKAVGVANITDKVRETRLRWYGHVRRREEHASIRRIMEAEVRGYRSRGRQRKRWIDVVNGDMKTLKLTEGDTEDRHQWRRRTRVADPSPEG
jgi:hypothetical protein